MSKGLTLPNYAGEPRVIPGVPSPRSGYGPGVVHPLSDAGLTEDQALAIIDAHPNLGLALEDLPAKKTKAKKTESEVAP